MKAGYIILAASIILFIAAGTVRAQFGGEDSRKTIAGVLIPGEQETAEWTFKSAGGEILFASLDAEIYRARTDEHDTINTLAEGDGCSDEGGPGLFYIKVMGPDGNVICSAEKPAPPPGWMRDPRMACVLPAQKTPVTYTLKVGLKTSTEDELAQDSYPFALNVSLRKIAPNWVNVEQAIGQSQNGF